jgi:hypothetical protein
MAERCLIKLLARKNGLPDCDDACLSDEDSVCPHSGNDTLFPKKQVPGVVFDSSSADAIPHTEANDSASQ